MFQHVDDLPDYPSADDEFWTQRPILTHIRAFAWARLVSPYAVLGGVMRRAVSCIEPYVVLPPTIGGIGSLNLFTANIGFSGQGKDAPEAAAREAVRFIGTGLREVGEHLDPPARNIGSGEGLARQFKGSKDTPPVTRVHVVVQEVKTLGALKGRQGSTLISELTKAFSGQPLGFLNNSAETSTAVNAHTYRLCLGISVQPGNAHIILNEADTGLPQRFLWLPTDDPNRPEQHMPEVQPVDVIIPATTHPGEERFDVVQIPDEARDEIRDRRLDQLLGRDAGDALDKHVGLLRLKVAFALAVLDGRKDINYDDWKLSECLLELSQESRERCVASMEDERRRRSEARAYERAAEQAIVDQDKSERAHKLVSGQIIRKLQRVGAATRSELSQNCESRVRAEFSTVFGLLLDGGQIVCCEEGGDGRAARYRLA